MGSLTRDQILSKRTLHLERVPVPEWAENGTSEVCVRRFSARTKQHLGELLAAASKRGEQLPNNWYATVCALAMCDETGQRIFTDPKDVQELGEDDADVLERVYQVAARLNGLTADAAEEVAKNSEPSLSVVSSSA